MVFGVLLMFDVYLSDKRVLLVVRKGFPIPLGGLDGAKERRRSPRSVTRSRQPFRGKAIICASCATLSLWHRLSCYQSSRHPRAIPRGQSLRRQPAPDARRNSLIIRGSPVEKACGR